MGQPAAVGQEPQEVLVSSTLAVPRHLSAFHLRGRFESGRQESHADSWRFAIECGILVSAAGLLFYCLIQFFVVSLNLSWLLIGLVDHLVVEATYVSLLAPALISFWCRAELEKPINVSLLGDSKAAICQLASL